MLWGSTVQCSLRMGACLLIEGTEKANHGASSGWRGMCKKQSLMSITTSFHLQESIDGEGIPGCRGPMSSMAALIFRRSWRYLHPFCLGFGKTKTGEFQGLLDGTMCPLASSFSTRDSRACSFWTGKGHCSTHMGVSDNQLMRGWSRSTVAQPKNFCQMVYEFESPIEIGYLCPTG